MQDVLDNAKVVTMFLSFLQLLNFSIVVLGTLAYDALPVYDWALVCSTTKYTGYGSIRMKHGLIASCVCGQTLFVCLKFISVGTITSWDENQTSS